MRLKKTLLFSIYVDVTILHIVLDIISKLLQELGTSVFLIRTCLQERIPIDEVFEQLKCTHEGLSSAEGANRLQIFGPNKLEEKKVICFLHDMLNNQY